MVDVEGPLTGLVCTSCDRFYPEGEEVSPLYACSRCGQEYVRDGLDDGNRCPDCHLFVGKQADTACEDCLQELEEAERFRCGDCTELHATEEAALACCVEPAEPEDPDAPAPAKRCAVCKKPAVPAGETVLDPIMLEFSDLPETLFTSGDYCRQHEVRYGVALRHGECVSLDLPRGRGGGQSTTVLIGAQRAAWRVMHGDSYERKWYRPPHCYQHDQTPYEVWVVLLGWERQKGQKPQQVVREWLEPGSTAERCP